MRTSFFDTGDSSVGATFRAPALSDVTPLNGLQNGLEALTELPVIGDELRLRIAQLQNGLELFKELEEKFYDILDLMPDTGDAAVALAGAINEIPDGANYTLSAIAEGTTVHLFISADGAKTFSFENLSVDIGDECFGLQAAVNVAVDLGAHLDIALDINVDTGEVSIAGPATPGGEELTLGLTAAVSSASDVTAQAKLGFLNITATDTITDRPEVEFVFTLDLPDAKVEDIELDQVGLALNGSADLGLHIVTSTDVDLLPTIAGDFNVHWGVGTSDPADTDGLGTRVAFDDVTVDFSSFLDLMAETFRPIKEQMLDSFPIATLIDAATAPFPIIDPLSRKIGVLDALDIIPLDPGDGTLNLMDIVAWYAISQG